MISDISILVRLIETLESAPAERTGKATPYFLRWLAEVRNTLLAYGARLDALELTNSGSVTGTPDGSGFIDITHGLATTPVLYKSRAQTVGTSFANTQLVSVSSTILRVILLDAAGAAITSGSWTVAWSVAA